MTSVQYQNNTKRFIILSMSAIIAVTMTILVVTQESSNTNSVTNSDSVSTIPDNGMLQSGTSPTQSTRENLIAYQPYEVKIDGKVEPTLISMQRGETKTIEVAISQKIDGIIGDITIYPASMPECGLSETPKECNEQPLDISISKNRITSADNLTLFVTVSKDTELGMYQYNLSVDTTVNIPDRQKPLNTGYTTAFTIQVL